MPPPKRNPATKQKKEWVPAETFNRHRKCNAPVKRKDRNVTTEGKVAYCDYLIEFRKSKPGPVSNDEKERLDECHFAVSVADVAHKRQRQVDCAPNLPPPSQDLLASQPKQLLPSTSRSKSRLKSSQETKRMVPASRTSRNISSDGFQPQPSSPKSSCYHGHCHQ